MLPVSLRTAPKKSASEKLIGAQHCRRIIQISIIKDFLKLVMMHSSYHSTNVVGDEQMADDYAYRINIQWWYSRSRRLMILLFHCLPVSFIMRLSRDYQSGEEFGERSRTHD